MVAVGSYCDLHTLEPVSILERGMDFRKPEYRREVFLRFYEFHLKYKSHPGGVYFLFDCIRQYYGLCHEDMLWLAFITGVCQNIVTAWIIFQRFPSYTSDADTVQDYITDQWAALQWDQDRRYVKTKFGKALKGYQRAVGRAMSQEAYWTSICTSNDRGENFQMCWKVVMNLPYFGRLSAFSYLEYLKIVGIPVECDSLFLEDISGSKSHRNGLLLVLGRDDLLGIRSQDIVEIVPWLRQEGSRLLEEARYRCRGKDYVNDISYFTLESTLCCYKSWHRPNRRYPNVYMDMLRDRIVRAEKMNPGVDLSMFWVFRARQLPKPLRLEDNRDDCGVKPEKQNHYLNTGEVIMMDVDWPCFENSFGRKQKKILP